jgi:chromosome partitioning protein
VSYVSQISGHLGSNDFSVGKLVAVFPLTRDVGTVALQTGDQVARTKLMSGRGRVLLVASPKGGVGKSCLCRNILVSAAREGVRVLGVDLDQQQTLAKWHVRRERVRQTYAECPEVPVLAVEIGEWRSALKQAANYDLVVIDTPPSIEAQYGAALSLCSAAHMVLIPTGATQDDVDSVTPWMRTLTEADIRASFVLNRANRRVKSYETIRTKLLQVGALCPVEIPLLEDIHVSAGKGLAVPDFAKAKASETFDALWAYIVREAGIKVSTEIAA